MMTMNHDHEHESMSMSAVHVRTSAYCLPWHASPIQKNRVLIMRMATMLKSLSLLVFVGSLVFVVLTTPRMKISRSNNIGVVQHSSGLSPPLRGQRRWLMSFKKVRYNYVTHEILVNEQCFGLSLSLCMFHSRDFPSPSHPLSPIQQLSTRILKQSK